MALAVFNAVDYFLTAFSLRLGFRELNPLIDAVAHTALFPIVKLLVVPLLLFFVWAVRKQVSQRIMLYTWTAFVVYLGLMVYFNVSLWRL